MTVSVEAPRPHLVRESGTAPIDALIEALQQYDVLTDHDLAVLSDLPVISKSYEKGSVIAQGRPPDAFMSADRGICRKEPGVHGRWSPHHERPHSRRPARFEQPFPEASGSLSGRLQRLRDGIYSAPRPLAYARPQFASDASFWLTTLIEAAIDRASIGCRGRRPAGDQVAHFFCETYTRLKGRRLADTNSFIFDATQADLGDALGLSLIRVNRTLQELRKLKLLSWENGVVTISNFPALARRAEFDPAYLYHYVEER